jgi:hypothetical protein
MQRGRAFSIISRVMVVAESISGSSWPPQRIEKVTPMNDRTTLRQRIQTTLPPEVLARIDALILRSSAPGRPATQAQILRDLVRLGLAELDARAAPGRGGPRSGRKRGS